MLTLSNFYFEIVKLYLNLKYSIYSVDMIEKDIKK